MVSFGKGSTEPRQSSSNKGQQCYRCGKIGHQPFELAQKANVCWNSDGVDSQEVTSVDKSPKPPSYYSTQ
jgi:hypothetical protein